MWGVVDRKRGLCAMDWALSDPVEEEDGRRSGGMCELSHEYEEGIWDG